MRAKRTKADLQAQLRPYQSYHLFEDPRPKGHDWKAFLLKLLDEAFQLTKVPAGEITEVGEQPRAVQVPESADGLRLAWMTYVKDVPVAWADEEAQIRDKENHIVLVAAASQHLALSTSDKALAGRVDRLRPSQEPLTLAGLRRVAPPILESALIVGNARILWMSAIHRDQAIRPNAKVLMGSNLEAALDPLSDQTFHYTSVRSDGPGAFGTAVPGVSPRKGRVWLAPSKKFQDFTTRTKALLELIRNSTPKPAPFPILARPLADITNVKEAFDHVLLPPESDGSSEDGPPNRYDLATSLTWTLTGSKNSSDVELTATLDATQYKVAIRLSATEPASATLIHPAPPVPGVASSTSGTPEEVVAALDLFRSDAMKVYYESGHTYSGGAVYEVLTRPVAFKQFRTSAFKGADICEEKPTRPHPTDPKKRVLALEDIGKPGEKSLFSWTLRERGNVGWLWCDDGSGEIADFIHLADDDTMTLYHLKAAHSVSGDVAVGAYEVVCAQALKNLRMLEGRDVVALLETRLAKPKPYIRCWRRGRPVSPKNEVKFINRIRAIPPSRLTRRAVVVQPHVSLAMLPNSPTELARSNPLTHRAMQLHTMLNGFEANFRNLDIGFEVIIRP